MAESEIKLQTQAEFAEEMRLKRQESLRLFLIERLKEGGRVLPLIYVNEYNNTFNELGVRNARS